MRQDSRSVDGAGGRVGSTRRHRRLATHWLAPAAGILGLVLLTSACSSSGASSPVSTTHPTATKAVTVSSARVGSLGSVLVDQGGLTLYRFTPDTTDHSTCTGGCAAEWPPLTVPTGGQVKAGTGVKGTLLGTITRADGSRQVVYAGLPLYRYKGDTAPGQANGQALLGTWFAVSASTTPAAATTTTTAPATTTTTSIPPAAPAVSGQGGSGGGSGGATPQTAPPVTAPPATAPPVTAPPVTAPPATAPPATAPPSTGGGGYGY
jgi:predicted lipoprotein with Yx(FWY)xxD motif